MPRPKKNKNAPVVPDTPSAQLFSEMPKTPKLNKADLLEDSDDEGEYAAATETPSLKVNEEYARRFEHNKKREEMQRLEEKFANSKKHGRDDSESEDSSSEDEDDIGMLATETLDKEIFATLAAIKNKDPRVYDGKTSFYTPIEATLPVEDDDAEKTVKPMFLRDYHRENLLAGNTGAEEEEEEPRTFAQQQAHLKSSVVAEMHKAAEDDDDDEGFMVRKAVEKKEKSTKSDLPDPSLADKDPEEFLNKFLASRAWTKTTGAAYVPIESDDSEDDDLADQFEADYNRRFEDPDAAARAKLVSFSRDAVSENTVRREEKSRRKKAREEKRRKKEEEKAQLEIEKGRLKKLKTEELMEKFKQIKEAADLDGDSEAEAEVLHKLLEGDFSDEEWDAWMKARFDDKYYEGSGSGKIKKPVFDDDIDIGDIASDFHEDDEDDEEGGVGIKEDDEEMADADADIEKSKKKKSKKEIVKEKQEKKAKDRSTRRKLERFVEDNFDFDAELGTKTGGFRYREATPEAYGLGTLDILAADDADLNAYAGLKKLASFRDEDKKKKDKKRYGKKKLLKQWRKDVFGSSEGIKMPADWKPEGLLTKKVEEAEAGKLDIKESGDGERKKKRRRKNKA